MINNNHILNNHFLEVTALDSRSSSQGSSPGWGHCVVFLGMTFYSHIASSSLHSDVQMSYGTFRGVTL